jgi:Flp pilus assembly protein TadG
MRRLLRSESGAVSAVLVVVMPLLILTAMFIVQFALAAHAQHIAQSAASRALAVARADGSSGDDGQARAEAILQALGSGVLKNTKVSVVRDADQVRVEITGTAIEVVPGVRLSVKAIAVGPVEKFRPDSRTFTAAPRTSIHGSEARR